MLIPSGYTLTAAQQTPEFFFLLESNHIERINEPPTAEQSLAFEKFMSLPKITVTDMTDLLLFFQPDARLRNIQGLNVRVGNYYPPKGGPEIEYQLKEILENKKYMNSWEQHVAFETLHPFTDGNGRTGRMLWAWRQRDLSLGFLHMFYYQTLQNSNLRKD